VWICIRMNSLVVYCAGMGHTAYLYYTRINSEGVIWGQKTYSFCMLLGYGPPNLHVSSSALICFQCSWAWNVQIRGPIPNRPRRELFEQPYAVSNQPVHQTRWFSVLWRPYNKYRSLQKQGSKKSKWLVRYATPPGKHPSRIQVHDVCF